MKKLLVFVFAFCLMLLTVAAADEIPAELLGNWQFTFARPDGVQLYFIFHENGKVSFFDASGKNSDSYELLDYTYKYHRIKLSASKCYISEFHVKNGIPIPETGWELKGNPKKLADGKVSRLKSCSIEYVYSGMENPGLILFDPSDDTAPNLTIDFTVKKNPKIPIDASLNFHISDPEVLEVARYAGWSVYLRGKKAGTVEVSVQPTRKNSKESNTLTFTVLEGEKNLPDDLVGVCWTIEKWGSKWNVVFDQKGRFISYIEYADQHYLYIRCGNYLYRDGMIQMSDTEFRWFCVDNTEGRIQLHCYGTGDTGGTWTRENLLKGENKCQYDTYLFTEDGIPAVGNKSWDELWEYYSKNHELQAHSN